MSTTPPRWARDPTGVFTHRYWDGRRWTERVAVDGREGSSPIEADPAEAMAVAARLRHPSPAASPPPPPPAPWSPPAGVPSPVVDVHGPMIHDLRVSSIGRRFGAYLLDLMLITITFGIGWIVWALVISGEAQTPAKRLMRMRCVDTRTGRALDWPTFVLGRGGINVIGGFVLSLTVVGVLVYLLPLLTERNQHYYGIFTSSTYVDI